MLGYGETEESYCVAAEKAEQLADEQRLEIAQLKEQRQADMVARAKEQRTADAKALAQEEATRELRTETNAKLR